MRLSSTRVAWGAETRSVAPGLSVAVARRYIPRSPRVAVTLCGGCRTMSRPEPESRVASWRRYLRFWGTNVEADVDDELEFHRSMRVEDYVARGMTETDARAAVTARLGALDRARSDCVATGYRMLRRRRRTHLMGVVRQDIG